MILHEITGVNESLLSIVYCHCLLQSLENHNMLNLMHGYNTSRPITNVFPLLLKTVRYIQP